MKINSIFHVFVFLMAILMFSTPFFTRAQESIMATAAIEDAKRDANADVNKLLWVGAGCLLSGVSLVDNYSCLLSTAGLIGTYFYRPNPPASRLIGKSPEYVTFYTEAYKAESGKLQALMSTAGCVGGGVVITGCAIVGLTTLGIATAVAAAQD